MAFWSSWLTPLVALVAYLAFWPVPISPVAWVQPASLGYTGAHAVNHQLAGLQHIALGEGQDAPEHITAHQGWLYTGLRNGDVIKFNAAHPEQRVRVANTSGRPLGIDFDAQGRMLVADIHKGLLRIEGEGPSAKIETVVTSVDGPETNDRVRLANAVKVAADGSIWFTDVSRREFGSGPNATTLEVMEHSCTGRLLTWAPGMLKAQVALSGVCFANGLETTADGKALLLAETGLYRILRVDTAKLVRAPSVAQAMSQGSVTVWADNLPGFPDNVVRSDSGRVWVGFTMPRSPVLDFAAQHPAIRSMIVRLPAAMLPVPKPYGHVVAFNDAGKVVDDLQDPEGAYPSTCSATEVDGRLYVHSLSAKTVGWMPYLKPRLPTQF